MATKKAAKSAKSAAKTKPAAKPAAKAKAAKATKPKSTKAPPKKAATKKPAAATTKTASTAKTSTAKTAKTSTAKTAKTSTKTAKTSTTKQAAAKRGLGGPSAAPKSAANELVPAPSAKQSEFLASIIANPDDKKARLVYADMLQEQGDPRGEYIILACTRAELPEGDDRAAELDTQIAAHEKKFKKAWSSACGENKGARYEYRRGFVECLSLNAADLLKNADKIFAAEPVEELSIWKVDESPTKIGKSRLAPILELPLHRIRRLRIRQQKLTADDFAALAEAKTLGSVEILDLANGGSVESPVGPIAKASLPKLRELDLRGCMMSNKSLESICASKTLKMQKLVLARNGLEGSAGPLIADAPWASGLVHLDLSSNEQFGDDGLRALADSKNLGALKKLILEFTGLYDEAVPIILESPLFKQLELLDISATGVDIALLEPTLGERVQFNRGV